MSDIDPKIGLELSQVRADLLQTVSETDKELREYASDKAERARNVSIGVVGFVIAVVTLTGALGINSLIGTMIEKRGISLVDDRINQVEDRLDQIGPKLSDVATELKAADESLRELQAELKEIVNTNSENAMRAVQARSAFEASLEGLNFDLQAMADEMERNTDALLSGLALISEAGENLNEERLDRLQAQIEELQSDSAQIRSFIEQFQSPDLSLD